MNVIFKTGVYHIPIKEDWIYLVDLLKMKSASGADREKAMIYWDHYKDEFCVDIDIGFGGRYEYRYSSYWYYESHKYEINEYHRNIYAVELL